MADSIVHLNNYFNDNLNSLQTGLLQHLEEHKRLSSQKLYTAGVDYLEQYLGLKSEELPCNPKDLIIYNCGFDIIYDYLKENYPKKNSAYL